MHFLKLVHMHGWEKGWEKAWVGGENKNGLVVPVGLAAEPPVSAAFFSPATAVAAASAAAFLS